MSGLKSETYPRPSRVPDLHGPVSAATIPGRSVPTELAGSLRGLRAVCRDSDSCVAFSFIKRSWPAGCSIAPVNISNDDSADSGAKRQAVN